MSIAFSCASCGKHYKVAGEMAGRKLKCKCGASMRVPSSSAKKKAAAKQPAAPAEDPMFAFETQPGEGRLEEGYNFSGERSRSAPPRKGGFPIFRLIIVPLFILFGVAALGLFAAIVYDVPVVTTLAKKANVPVDVIQQTLLPGASIENDAQYFPNDCQVVAVLNVDHLLKSETFKKLEEEAEKHKVDVAEWKKLGDKLSLDDIQRISVGLGGKDRIAISVVRFKAPVDPDDIQESPMLMAVLVDMSVVAEGKFPTSSKPEKYSFTRDTVGKHVVYDSEDFAFALIGDRAFAFGPKQEVHDVLARTQRNRLPKRLQQALAKTDPWQSTFAWAMTAAAIPEEDRALLEQKLGDDYLKKIDAMAVSVKLKDGIALNTTFFCKDEESAAALAEKAGKTLTAAAVILQAFGPAKGLLETTSTTARGRYTVSVTTDVDKLIQAKAAITRIITGNAARSEDKPKEKEKDKEDTKPAEKDKAKDADKAKDKAKDKDAEKSKDKEADKANDKDAEKSKDKEADKAKDKAKDKDAEKGKDKDAEKSKDKDADRAKDKAKDKDADKAKDKAKDKDAEKGKGKDGDKDKAKDKDADKPKDE
jgi:hypothetical protein